MIQEQIDKLNQIDYWFWEYDLDVNWNQWYEKLKKFIEIHNRLPSDHTKKKEEKQLGTWCSNQRAYKKNDKLEKWRIDKLNQLIGWFWEYDFDANWNQIYDKLKTFFEINNRLPLQQAKQREEKLLGHWCSNQRIYKKMVN